MSAARLAGGRAHLRGGTRDAGRRPSRRTCPRGRSGTRRTVPSPGSSRSVTTVLSAGSPSHVDRRRRALHTAASSSIRLRRRGCARRGASGARCSTRSSTAAPAHGIWTIQTSIMTANGPSLALHAAAGFRRRRPARADRRARTASWQRHAAPRAAAAVRALCPCQTPVARQVVRSEQDRPRHLLPLPDVRQPRNDAERSLWTNCART